MYALLFAVYVNGVFESPRASKLGSNIGDMYVRCSMYADDLVLLPSSLIVCKI